MAYQISEDIDYRPFSTGPDIRASDRARTNLMVEKVWLDRLFRHFPEVAKHVMDIQIDWPNRLPNTVIVTLDNKRQYLYTSDPKYDHGTLERI